MSKLPRHQLAAVLAERSLANLDVKTFSEELAAYLLSEGRTGELDSLMRDIMQYRADHGIVEVLAVSAHALNDATRKEVNAQVHELYPNAIKIIITEQIDHDVIGGVRLELANQQLDLSIRSKLNRFKQLTAVGE
ncbi:MAG TPA: F0F1 ATP synthase subunit delta [Candidatus Saccharimonadales bacterium]|nr:F0F1 ATP synthase subunit delta [Candidatus Saccharimonadales bacterium]